jgi:predicted ATPase
MVPIDLNEEYPSDYYSLAQPAAVRLFLEDGESRKTEFEDVGSGVPFVLSVLCAAVVGGLAKIQQPELHLHPALQSSIADVFIEEIISNSNKQFIIETHSEHLLLRLLRRIRDTENSVSTSIDLPLKPSDIAIYYFDPQVNGGTIVTRQLVTPLGDFYNDWPKGFFAERDGDLFNV